MLEALEAREACNSLYNPLFGSAFLALDDLTDVPYSVVPGDDGSDGGTGAGQDGSDGGAGSDPISWTDPAAPTRPSPRRLRPLMGTPANSTRC